MNEPKKTFMSNHGKYYCNGIPFKLKNPRATYQRVIDVVFSKEIGRNLEVYIDDMIVKTSEEVVIYCIFNKYNFYILTTLKFFAPYT